MAGCKDLILWARPNRRHPRRHDRGLTDDRSRQAVNVAEQYADAVVGRRVLAAARRAADAANISYEIDPRLADPYYPVACAAALIAQGLIAPEDVCEAKDLARKTSDLVSDLLWHIHSGNAETAEQVLQSQILRDIVGNAFRPVTFSPAWRTPTAVGLAEAIYEGRVVISIESRAT